MAEPVAYAQSHPNAVRQVITTYTTIKQDQTAAMTLPKFAADIDTTSIDKLHQVMVTHGLLKGPTNSATARSILMLVVYASFWQVLIQVLHGVSDVDPVARDTAGSYRLGRWLRTVYLTWPTTAPYVMTGIRLSASVALVLTITGELLI